MRDVQIYLSRVHANIPADADRTAFPLTLPFVEGLDIAFRTPVTFLVGENGSGKSTLLEALVDLADLPARGGGRNELSDHGGESELAPFLIRTEGVEGFPLLFTANVDVTVFPEVWDGDVGGDERLVLKPGIVVDSDKMAVVVRSNGCVQILKGKYARRKSLFGPNHWKLAQQTYFLTPTGKVCHGNR